ncbi:uncharacterized protein LOC119604873 [Lucilia sericata]|uniref:uncharacterized protein LOC119604873 n=1 Tax=Lucilia sericata TaxID=13632 RepID=UPI0018A81FF4|nr:uncharacterized protein LOC119604873 [Lucilia sericata]
MFLKVKEYIFILALIGYLKLAKTEDNTNVDVKENHKEFYKQILTLKEIVAELDREVEQLLKGFNQQADIIFGDSPNNASDKTEFIPEIPINQSEKIQEFYTDFNSKLLNLNNDTENLLNINDNLFWNKTQTIYQIIEAATKCPINRNENISSDIQYRITNILEKLDKHITRCDILKEKIENLNKQEEVLVKNSENLSSILAEINAKLDSQNQYFENLEKQLPIIQEASKTLDDYIIRKNEHESYRQRCWETGNCRHGHHRGQHYRHSHHYVKKF